MRNPRRLPLTLALRGFPLSFQRYATGRRHGKRFQGDALRDYQANINLAALQAGIRQIALPSMIRVTCLFFLPPMKSEAGSVGFSLDPKDLDNLTKAAVDGLGDFFNDRIVVLDRNLKAHIQEESLYGTIVRLDTARWSDAVHLMTDTLAGQEAARPWLQYIQTHTSS